MCVCVCVCVCVYVCVCDKGFIWNPSTCEYECGKSSSDVGEYLDYENCICRKKLVHKLVEECTETLEEVKLAKIISAEDESKHKCNSCTLYIVLFQIIFTINVGIWFLFTFFYFLKKNKAIVDLKETTLY